MRTPSAPGSLIRPLIIASLALCAATSAEAQITIMGTPAFESHTGTNGGDFISTGGGRDTVFTNPGFTPPGHFPSDGVKDHVDASDNMPDVIFIGPEDVVSADPDDTIHIHSQQGKRLWSGTLSEYLNMKKFFDRLRKRIKNLLSQLSVADAMMKERDHHVAMADFFAAQAGPVVIADYFAADEFILPADLSELEEIPELLAWFPSLEESGDGPNTDANDQDAEKGDDTDTISAADLAAIFEGLVAMIDDLSDEGSL